MKLIRGSGGGDSQPAQRVPVESPDSLRSRAFVQIIDLLGEGEIEGLVNGLRSIYLDGTAIQNDDGTSNFSGVNLDFRTGSQDQPYLEGFSSTENEIIISTEFKKPTGSPEVPVTRTFTNPELDAVRVRISTPQLTYTNSTNGDVSGTRLEYQIELRSNGGTFEPVARDKIIGKSTSKYERSYRVDLTGSPPWDIRVRRITPDSTTTYLQNKTYVESMTEIIDAKFKYPNSAIVGIRVDSSQFSNIPSRAYDVKLLRVRIPDNYNPRTRTYDGIWSGNFYSAWTDNPVWCLYDLLTNERYGLGNYIPEAQVDKWAFYTIGRYCDELVSDGRGGTEPRFSLNCYIQSREDAFKVLQDMASVFRGMLYWANGTLTVSQDSPEDPAFLFTPANVVDGLFNYSGSSAKSRHTVALVNWNDPDDFYRRKIEYVEDVDGIARYGVIETQITAFGCTSRSQANRVGRWLLYSEQYQTETVQFRTGLQGATCRPGQIIKVADPTRAGSRRGGRILSATTTTITIDQSITVDPSTHSLSVMLPDGSLEERALSTASGNSLTVVSPFTTAPLKGSIWMIASSAVEPQLFKIIGIGEADDGSHDITALAHDPQKYAFIENGVALEPRSISDLSEVPDAPIGLAITETLYEVNSDVRVKVTVSWNPVPNATSYVVQYYRDTLNPINLPETVSNDVEILNAEPGTYYVTVWAINAVGIKSTPSKANRKIFGKAAPPASVQGFSLLPVAGVAYLSWNKSSDLDVLIGGTVRIRYSPNVIDPVWRNAVDIVPALPGNATRVQAPLLEGTYMAKFIDSSGVPCMDESLIVTTVPAPLALNVVETITESPTFSGSKTNMEYFADYGGLALQAAFAIDDYLPNVDEIPNWDFAGGVNSTGTYNFASIVDLSNVYTSKVTAAINAETIDTADTVDLRTELVDDWIDLDGDLIDDVNAELFLQTTLDDPTLIGAVWTEWKRFFVGEYIARGYRFQLRATSESASHNIVVKNLAVTVDMPDRIVSMKGIVSGTSSYSVTYAEAFHETPVVGITAFGMNSGDYYRITGESRTGFTVTFYNSSNTIISRTFDLYAKGYGREII